jgi:hypothetical protein
MGNAVEKGEGQEEEQSENFLEKYTIVRKFNDARFGECSLLQESGSRSECVMREINSTDEEEYSKNCKKYQQRALLRHPNIVQLLACYNRAES